MRVRPSSPEWGAVVRNLMPSQVPLVLAGLVTCLALDPGPGRVDVDDVLLQVELVTEDPLADGTDTRLPAVPQPPTTLAVTHVVILQQICKHNTLTTTHANATQQYNYYPLQLNTKKLKENKPMANKRRKGTLFLNEQINTKHSLYYNI